MAPVTAFSLVPFSDLADRCDAWRRLAAASQNVFATWEWASTWWRHYGSDAVPAFQECVRADGSPFAILPLYVAPRGRLRALRFLGHGPGDVLGPVCAERDAPLAGTAVAHALRERPRKWHVFLAEELPRGSVGQAIGGTCIRIEANPYLDIAGSSWEQFLAGRSRNLREKIRRSARRLEARHEVSYRLCDDASRLDADLDSLMRLHAARWGTWGAFDGKLGVFHRDFAHRALEAGWLRLWLMEVDGRSVAAWYGFRFEGVDSFYQHGRDPAWDQHSVGFQLVAHTIRCAFDDGMRRYAFLRGHEPYKNRFANGDDGLETRAIGRGPVSSALVALGIGVARRSPRLRRRLVRAVA
jgi:CelD/BcsL family acetyltransferase involved in cellulose biosynthesis